MTDTLGCARNGAFTRACPTSSPFALNTCIASRRHAAGRSIVSTSRASAPLERTLSALPPARQPKQLTSSTANSTAPFVPSATSKRRPAVAYTSTLRRTTTLLVPVSTSSPGGPIGSAPPSSETSSEAWLSSI